MKKEFTVIIEQDEQGYFIAEVPELAGCHTQAKSLDILMERTKEAIQLCLEVYGRKSPKTHLVGVQKVVVPVHSGETIGPGLLSKVLKDVEMTKEVLTKSR